MTLPLAYHREVRADIDEAYQWYEGKQEGLGEDFLVKLGTILEGVQEFPELYGRVFQNIRAARVPRFPYLAYYRIDSERILVLAIQRSNRSIRRWRHRRRDVDE